jgi:hypothetical protein
MPVRDTTPRRIVLIFAALTFTLLAVPSAYLAAAPAAAVLVGAGDIAWCGGDGDEATARLLDAIPGTVFTTGDNAYPDGTDAEFARCFHPTWGRHRARMRPSPGNHDYHTRRAAPYFRYFGAAAGESGKGYYTYTLGAWRVVVLNSNCELIGGCGEMDPQAVWLRRVLAESTARCAVAYWHHPRFSSGPHGPAPKMQAAWKALHAAGVEVALAGHEHLYERFAPQDAHGDADPAQGVRQFTAGTGGRSHYGFRAPAPNSEVRHTGTFGVLKLTLQPSAYTWEFIPEAGRSFRDTGAAACY